jgi:hypothetical protein
MVALPGVNLAAALGPRLGAMKASTSGTFFFFFFGRTP